MAADLLAAGLGSQLYVYWVQVISTTSAVVTAFCIVAILWCLLCWNSAVRTLLRFKEPRVERLTSSLIQMTRGVVISLALFLATLFIERSS
ncbi:hypothetical protein EOS_33595 [Caballeronia mineralivorans PML1(12)]|uniref:Uncharacterized protein n=1 Tax=Caballeronia mineralivorans PML1(12) TaxID=908627 RepID=A0A0J1FQ41_9BURK|nr:hypothetical protein EOS_33595 [Caballeronia mineralivorans PML1(12)]